MTLPRGLERHSVEGWHFGPLCPISGPFSWFSDPLRPILSLFGKLGKPATVFVRRPASPGQEIPFFSILSQMYGIERADFPHAVCFQTLGSALRRYLKAHASLGRSRCEPAPGRATRLTCRVAEPDCQRTKNGDSSNKIGPSRRQARKRITKSRKNEIPKARRSGEWSPFPEYAFFRVFVFSSFRDYPRLSLKCQRSAPNKYVRDSKKYGPAGPIRLQVELPDGLATFRHEAAFRVRFGACAHRRLRSASAGPPQRPCAQKRTKAERRNNSKSLPVGWAFSLPTALCRGGGCGRNQRL